VIDRRGRRGGRGLSGIALSGVVIASAVACAGGGGDSGVATTTVVTTTTLAPRPSDGVLRLGVLMPQSGPGADLGRAVLNSVRIAVREVNLAGGVLGRDIEVVTADEGADIPTALAAVNTLIVDEGADAIIGPASSRIALGVLGQVVGQGVLACSPVATAIALSSFPDQGLFFRTVPSDALQADAIARLVDQTGRNRVGVLHPDDVYGRDFADAVVLALTAQGTEVTATVGYAPDADDLSGPAREVVADEPPAVVVLGNADLGARMLVAAAEAAGSPSPWFIVNDAIRRPLQPSALAELDEIRRQRLRGVSPAVLPTSPELLARLGATERDPATMFASMAFDCVNLIALGALDSDTDDARAIAADLVTLSRGGSTCRDFASCAQLLREDRNVDYNGLEGLLRLDNQGDVSAGAFERFAFDETGRDITDLRFTVGTVN